MRMYTDSFSHTGAHPIFYANRSDSFSDTTANNCRQLSLSGTVRDAYSSSHTTTDTRGQLALSGTVRNAYSSSHTTTDTCGQLALSGTNRNAYTSSDATTFSSYHTKPYT